MVQQVLSSVLLVLATIPATNEARAQSGSKDAELTGIWQLMGESGGKKVGYAFYEFKDGALGVFAGTFTLGQGKYTVDGSKNPKEIDLPSFVHFGPAGTSLKGIYRVQGDSLTIMLVRGNIAPEKQIRPSNFDDTKNKDVIHITLERVWNAMTGPDLILSIASDEFTKNGIFERNLKKMRELEKLMMSENSELRSLAEDTMLLVEKRAKAKIAEDYWRKAAMDPKALRNEIAKRLIAELPREDTAENRQKFADDIATAFLLSGPNNARVHAAGELLFQLDKVQSVSLVPVLKSRYQKATPNNEAVSVSIAIPEKPPAEITIVNKGKMSLHNIIFWYYMEVTPPPGLSADDVAALSAAAALGARRFVLTNLRDKALQDRVSAMGARNVIFVPILGAGDVVKVKYDLGSLRRCKRAEFSLYSDEVIIARQRIEGVEKAQQWIEKRFAPKGQ